MPMRTCRCVTKQKSNKIRFFPLNPLVLIFRSPSWRISQETKEKEEEEEEGELPKQESPDNRSFSQRLPFFTISRGCRGYRIFSEPHLTSKIPHRLDVFHPSRRVKSCEGTRESGKKERQRDKQHVGETSQDKFAIDKM